MRVTLVNPWNIVAYSGSFDNLADEWITWDDARTALIINAQNAYTWTIIENEWWIEKILWVDLTNTGEVDEVSRIIVNNDLNWDIEIVNNWSSSSSWEWWWECDWIWCRISVFDNTKWSDSDSDVLWSWNTLIADVSGFAEIDEIWAWSTWTNYDLIRVTFTSNNSDDISLRFYDWYPEDSVVDNEYFSWDELFLASPPLNWIEWNNPFITIYAADTTITITNIDFYDDPDVDYGVPWWEWWEW